MNKYYPNKKVFCWQKPNKDYVFFYEDCPRLLQFTEWLDSPRKNYDCKNTKFIGEFITPDLDMLKLIPYLFQPGKSTYIGKFDVKWSEPDKLIYNLIKGMYEDHICKFISINKEFHQIWRTVHSIDNCYNKVYINFYNIKFNEDGSFTLPNGVVGYNLKANYNNNETYYIIFNNDIRYIITDSRFKATNNYYQNLINELKQLQHEKQEKNKQKRERRKLRPSKIQQSSTT